MSLLGHRVRDMRKRAGLSQTELAKLAGVGQSTVSEVEHNKISPKTVGAIAALARQFDTTADFLLGLTDDPSPAPRRQLPEYGTELLEIIRELSPARGEELLEIARVLYASYMRRSKLEWLANALESTDNQM